MFSFSFLKESVYGVSRLPQRRHSRLFLVSFIRRFSPVPGASASVRWQTSPAAHRIADASTLFISISISSLATVLIVRCCAFADQQQSSSSSSLSPKERASLVLCVLCLLLKCVQLFFPHLPHFSLVFVFVFKVVVVITATVKRRMGSTAVGSLDWSSSPWFNCVTSSLLY